MRPDYDTGPEPRNRLPLSEAEGLDRAPVYALLDNVRSVWNVGSMFRSADAASLRGLFLCGMTATPPRPDMEKTALGATETVPWDYWPDSRAAVDHLRAAGVRVIALEQTPDALPYDRLEPVFPACFVVGHEVRGVAAAVAEAADVRVEIPMSGAKQSLNVAVSFGLMAFEMRRLWLRARSAEAGR